MDPVIIGIDQSYTGFGFCTGGKSIKKAFPTSKWPSNTMRLLAIEQWLMERIDALDDVVDLVVMEGYANAAKFGREMAGELGWAVKRTIWDVLEQEAIVVPPTSLKKFVTGSGGAKKNEMLLGVYKRWGAEFSDDNQADAFALEKFGFAYLDYVEQRDMAEHGWAKFQIEAVKAVHSKK